jgi:hypothetical protein
MLQGHRIVARACNTDRFHEQLQRINNDKRRQKVRADLSGSNMFLTKIMHSH